MSDRRGAGGGMPPHANGAQTIDARARQGQIALVVTGLRADARGGRFNQRGGNARRIQRNRQTRSHQATANDQHAAGIYYRRSGCIHVPIIPKPAAHAASLR